MLESLGHYKILERIGAGGLGEVFRARDTRLGRTVAIKTVGPAVAGDPPSRERLLADARAGATLSHPNIATLYEIGEDQGQLFLAFEFVPGETLDAVIAGRPLNPRRAVDFAIQIADALADMHAQNLVHADVKPANIIITPKDKAKLLDAGLAAWTGGGAERGAAARGAATASAQDAATLRTVAYMSPEQGLGEEVDPRTDIFSLGVVFFEMLTGRPPFAGATQNAVLLQIVQAPAPAPTSINRSLPPEVDAIVARALAKSLPGRYESVATMAAELRSLAAILDVRSEALEAAEPRPTGVAPRQRSNIGWVILLLVLAALAAAAWWARGDLQRLWRQTSAAASPSLKAASEPRAVYCRA